MQNNYNFSLIIPHFNTHRLLERLLKSLPDREDLQVIVVDDCSNNDLNILEEVKQKFPKVEWYSTGTNGGGGKARNIGLEHANGKYLIFADSDDYFLPAFNDILETYNDESIDLVYFKAQSINEENGKLSDRGDTINGLIDKYSKKNILNIKQKFTAPWCRLISLQLVKKHKILFKENPVYNDMFFSMRVEQYAKRIKLDKTPGYCVTKRTGSVSSVTNIQKEIQKMESVREYYDYAKKFNLKIVPLRNLLLPMMDEIYNEKHKVEFELCCDLWEKSHISRNKLIAMYYRARFERVVLPALIKCAKAIHLK